MTYQDITQYNSPNYTSGRPYGIHYIVIHWWDDPSNHPMFDAVINTLCNPKRGASAHYIAEAGRVACIVDPDDRAWHAGDGVGVGSKGNDKGIGIECNPRQSDGDYATIAELIRDLRAMYGDLPLIRHRDCSSTQCPGTYDLDRLDKLARGLTAPADPARHIRHNEARSGRLLGAAHHEACSGDRRNHPRWHHVRPDQVRREREHLRRQVGYRRQ